MKSTPQCKALDEISTESRNLWTCIVKPPRRMVDTRQSARCLGGGAKLMICGPGGEPMKTSS
jgi:hypothetical protein